MDSDVYDEKDETQLNFLESTITGAVSIKAKLKAVKDVESMTKRECNMALNELDHRYNALNAIRHTVAMEFLSNGRKQVFKTPQGRLIKILGAHLKEAFDDISKLTDLLNARIDKLSPVLNGKFGKNVQPLLSGFKYVAKDYDVKDHSKVQVDLQYLSGDPTLRKDVIDRLFDDDISNVKTPFDHSIMKQESASKPDDQPVIEVISDDQNYDAPKLADVQNIPADNLMEKQHLQPKGDAGDLMCFGKKSQPPEEEIDDAIVVTVNGCPLEPMKVDGSKVKLQSLVNPI